jgi:hypothetical protein
LIRVVGSLVIVALICVVTEGGSYLAILSVFETVRIRLRTGAGVPIRSLDVADGGDGFEGDFG